MTTGIDSNCTRTAIYLSTGTEKRGTDGLPLASPYYSKVTWKGLMAHFTAVADAVKVPVILYNILGRTGVATKPKTIAALCRDVGNIVGVGEASDNFPTIAALMSLSGGEVDLYSSNDDQIVPLLSLGGKGVISVPSDVTPRQTYNICASYFTGDVKASAALQLKAIPLITKFFSKVGPVPVKAATNMMGKGVKPLRIPLAEVEPQNQKKLKKAMIAYDILQGRFRGRTVYQW